MSNFFTFEGKSITTLAEIQSRLLGSVNLKDDSIIDWGSDFFTLADKINPPSLVVPLTLYTFHYLNSEDNNYPVRVKHAIDALLQIADSYSTPINFHESSEPPFPNINNSACANAGEVARIASSYMSNTTKRQVNDMAIAHIENFSVTDSIYYATTFLNEICSDKEETADKKIASFSHLLLISLEKTIFADSAFQL